MSLHKIKNIINKLGDSKKEIEKYSFVKILNNNVNNPIILVKHKKSNQYKKVFYKRLLRGFLPFKQSEYKKIKNIVNKLGKKSINKKEHYKYLMYVGKNNEYHKMIKIQNLHTKEIKICTLSALKRGVQPFNKTCNSKERKYLHPIVKKILKRNGYRFDYEKSIDEERKQRPDFIVYKDNKYVIVEVKHDETFYGQDIDNNNSQINKYHKSLKKDTNYQGSIIVSNNGIVGYDFKTMLKEVKSMLEN